MERRTRVLAPGLLPGLVLALTTACSASWAGGGSRPSNNGASWSASFASATGRSPWSSSSSSATGSSSGSRAISLVTCTGSTCSITLGGAGASAQVFGVPLVFQDIAGGRASVLVGGSSVTCREGEHVSAGRLALSCTRVTGDTVSFSGEMR